MNCFEQLNEYIKGCDTCNDCYTNCFIITYKELQEHDRKNFDYYNEKEDLLIYCKKCETYEIFLGESKPRE